MIITCGGLIYCRTNLGTAHFLSFGRWVVGMVKRNVDFSCLKNTSAMIIGVYSCYLANIFRSRVHHNDSFYICCFPMSRSSSTLIGRNFVEITIFFMLKQYFFIILYMIFLLMKCLQFQVQIYKTRLTTLFRWAFFLALLIEKISCTNHSKSSLVLADVDVTQCSKIRKSAAMYVQEVALFSLLQ